MIETVAVRMTDPSKVAELRRVTLERARALTWNEEQSGKAALIATEIGTNLIKHAQEGAVIVAGDATGAGSRLHLVAIDHGPGIDDIEACFVDGYSTAGSPGTGLGAARRISGSLELFSTPGKGTVLAAELLGPPVNGAARPEGFGVGGVCIPCPGESVSGDIWEYLEGEDTLMVMVCDGLGHGTFAAEASQQARAAFRNGSLSSVTAALSRVHDALRATRGAAGAIARIDRRAGQLRFSGVGNITGSIVDGTEVRHLVSHNGILGHGEPRIAEFVYPWNDTSQLVMHSDGLSARWRVNEWPGLWQRAPSLIAGVLCRDWIRGRDDATAVIARGA